MLVTTSVVIALALTACSTSSALPPTSRQATSAIVFSSKGLGVAKIGDDADTVVATLTKLLGQPTSDSGWHPEQIGCDIGEEIRDVLWGQLGVELSNGPSSIAPKGVKHLLAYFYNVDEGAVTPYRTETGLTIGDSVARVKSLYPKARISNSEIEGPVYSADGDFNGLNGNLSSLTPDGKVTSIRSGVLCID